MQGGESRPQHLGRFRRMQIPLLASARRGGRRPGWFSLFPDLKFHDFGFGSFLCPIQNSPSKFPSCLTRTVRHTVCRVHYMPHTTNSTQFDFFASNSAGAAWLWPYSRSFARSTTDTPSRRNSPSAAWTSTKARFTHSFGASKTRGCSPASGAKRTSATNASTGFRPKERMYSRSFSSSGKPSTLR